MVEHPAKTIARKMSRFIVLRFVKKFAICYWLLAIGKKNTNGIKKSSELSC